MARITTGLLCEHATVRDGLLFVLSGCLTRIARPDLPAPAGIMVALVVEIPPEEIDQAHEVTIVVKQNETAKSVARIVTGFQVHAVEAHPGESVFLPLVADIRNAELDAYGGYDVQMTVDSNAGPYLTFYVGKPPA